MLCKHVLEPPLSSCRATTISSRLERVHVTPETVVECPKCGFEFKVCKSLR